MGKYSHLIDTLPRLSADPERQEILNAVKAQLLEITPRQGSAFAALYAALRKTKDDLKDELSVVELKIEALSALLVDQYEAEGITNLKLDSGESVAVQYEPHAAVQDREAFRLWCIEDGLERSLALPWQTTNALVKERLLKGLAEPDGVLATAVTKLVLRKG